MKFLNQLSAILLFLGAMSAILAIFDRVPKALAWIYNWGDTTAYLIIGGLLFTGTILLLITRKKVDTTDE